MVAHGKSNDLAVKRHEREARTLLERDAIDPAYAWMAIGAAMFLQGKHRESVEALNNAVKLAPMDEPVLGNACSIFSIVGETELAVDRAHRLLGLVITRDGRMAALRVLEKALRFEEVLEIGEKVNIGFSDAYKESAKHLLSIADDHGATPELRARLIDAAVTAVRTQGYLVRQTTLVQVKDQLRYELFIDETARRCAEVNFAIAEALCEQFEDPVPEFVTFSCRPLSSFQFSGDIIEVRR